MPRPDGDFSAWANHAYEALNTWYATQGFSTDDLNPLKEALESWNEAYPAHVAAQAAAQAARQAKDLARAEVERSARGVVAFVQGYPATTNADRAIIGITIRDTSRTRSPQPTTRPQALVQAGQRLTHTLRLTDESTPTRRARPRGVLGAEVWVKLVAPPGPAEPAPTDPIGDPATFSFLTLSTKPTLRAEFPTTAGGKTAVYMARWVSTQGEKGPWSEICTATVAA
jgi:hypothetical protein